MTRTLLPSRHIIINFAEPFSVSELQSIEAFPTDQVLEIEQIVDQDLNRIGDFVEWMTSRLARSNQGQTFQISVVLPDEMGPYCRLKVLARIGWVIGVSLRQDFLSLL